VFGNGFSAITSLFFIVGQKEYHFFGIPELFSHFNSIGVSSDLDEQAIIGLYHMAHNKISFRYRI